MKIIVVFDTPYAGWQSADHEERMAEELAAAPAAEPESEYQIARALRAKGHEVTLCGVHHDLSVLTTHLKDSGVELIFNAAEAYHGSDGHDYLLPAVLEAQGYRYTGSPPVGLMVTRNKAMSKKILAHHGVRVPSFETYGPGETAPDTLALKFPVIVKPLQTDASVGISQASVVRDLAALRERVTFVHDRFHGAAIVEEFIDGRELYVSLVGNGDSLEVLPIMELVFDKEKSRPEERIATQKAKWDEPYRQRKGIRTVFARPLSKVAQERIEYAARAAYKWLWLRDYARLDIRLDAEDQVWVLEVNANPFIAFGHEIADSADKAGMKYDDFIERIVKEAVARFP
jgi:D-alanine-D-alanine ligase